MKAKQITDFHLKFTIGHKVTGVTAPYTLPNNPVAGTLLIWKNGAILDPAVDFSLTAGNTVTPTTTPISADEFIHFYLN